MAAAIAATDTPAAPTVTDTVPSAASATAAAATIAAIVSPTVPAATLTPVGATATMTATAIVTVTAASGATAMTTTPSTVLPSATPPATDTTAATVAPTPALTDTAITTTVAALNAAPAVTETGLTQGYGRLPLSFVPNRGQVDPAVQFVSRAPGLALYLTAGDATLVLVKPRPHGHRHPLSHGSALLATTGLSATVPISAAAVRLHFVGANTAAHAVGQNQLPGIANYLIGRDPAGWRTGLPTYAQVSYQNVYPGVDLVYYGNQAQLEYDWRVAPGADPHAIAFQVQGARGLSVDGDGALVVATDVGALVQRPPTVYQQDADGTRHAVAARYTLSATGAQSATVGFEVGAYDPGKPLVIDPVLSYSTYLGGNDSDQGTAIAVDRTGAAYLTGDTFSTNFPTTPGVIQRTGAAGSNDDAFVTKLNPSGTALVYSTYLGGATGGDFGKAIAVDRAGDAYLTGFTRSTDFPTTPGAFQRTNLGTANLYEAAFVSKLNPTGGTLLYSTYLTAASGDVDGHGLAIDSAGDAYVTGWTNATDFPTTPGAPQTSNGGSTTFDAFVSKLNPAGSALLSSTYLGGSSDDAGNAIAVDGAGNASVAGESYSSNFPTTANAYQKTFGGGSEDAFVARYTAAGSLSYATYLGGSGADVAFGVAVDAAGDTFVTGGTSSANFPTTAGAYQTSLGGSGTDNAVVSKLNPAGSSLVYSTYLGGSGGDDGYALAVDGVGNAYVAGMTYSTNFPTTPGAPQTHSGGGSCTGGCSDAFVTKLTATGSALAYSTYLGGSNNDVGQGVAVDRAGNTYVTGYTLSTNFPTVNPEQGTFGGNTSGGTGDAFVSKIGANRLPPTIPPGGSGAVAWHPHQGGGGSIGGGVGLSVDLADGHVDVSVPGLSLPGRGPNLAFTRTWDSALAQTGADGTGWQSSLTPRMSGDLSGVVYYTAEDGATWPFTYTGSAADPGPYTSYQTTPGKPWQLATSTAGYTLTNVLTSETMTFDGQGRLLADSDAYGNQNTMTYGPNGVTSEANSGGRTLSFGYTNGQLGDAMSPLWQSSGGAQGQHVHYGYNGSGQLTTSTLGAGTTDAVTTTFGYSGTQMTSITTGMGRTWSLLYDGQGRLMTVTSPLSGTSGQVGYTPIYTRQFIYNPGQTQMIAGAGTGGALTTTYTLDGQGEVTAFANGLGHTSHANYDADHDVLSSADANGNVTTNAYAYVGSNGSTGLITQTVQAPIQAYSPLNGTTISPVMRYSYDSTTHDLIEMDRPEGGRNLYSYNGHHSITTMTEQINPAMCGSMPCAPQWRGHVTTYDQYGGPVSMVDGRGVTVDANGHASLSNNASSYTRHLGYNLQGDQTSQSTPPITTTLNGVTSTAPVTTAYTYDGDGDKITTTAGNADTLSSGYDHLGRLMSAGDAAVTLYTGATIIPIQSLSYDGDGHLVREVDGNSNVTTDSYDPLGRLVSDTNPISGTRVMTYSATEKVAEQDAQGNVTTYGYDAAGRIITESDSASGAIQFQYDSVGNSTAMTVTDRDLGTPIQIQTQQYDALNRVITGTVTGPGATPLTTAVRYDQDGNVAQVMQPNGDIVYNTYDAADQLIAQEIDPKPVGQPAGVAYKSYVYDAVGNQIGSIDADNRTRTTTYDADNRAIQSIDTSLAPTGTTTITTTTQFDPNGNRMRQTTQTSDPTAPGQVETHTYVATYNANNWQTSASDDGLLTNYGYDGIGQERTQTIIDGVTPVRMQLDPAGRATSITESAGGSGPYATLFGYNHNDEVVTMTMPGGVQENATYDADSRTTHLAAIGPTGGSAPLLSGYDYGYNALGQTIGLTTTDNGAITGTQITHDALGRVIAQQGEVSGPRQWTYDKNGNFTSIVEEGVTTVYTYSASIPNEEMQQHTTGHGVEYFSYDRNGNTTVMTSTDTTAPYAINTHLSYDSRSRLRIITLIDGRTVRMGYNAAGQRTSYTVTNAVGQTLLSEHFQYRGNELGQVTVNGPQNYTDTYLYNQDGTPLELLRQQGGTTNRYWYVLDGRDNVVALTDVNGNVVDRYSYDIWGEPERANESVPQQLRYAGAWYDTELGWYWLRVRSYDPEGRFLQPDPSGVDGARTYVYAFDDPADANDPTGLSPDYKTPPSWLATLTDPTSTAGSVDPLNVVVSANSFFDMSLIFIALSSGGGPKWTSVPIGKSFIGGGTIGCPISSLSADVGAGRRPQDTGWRRGGPGGCLQFIRLAEGGNHARVFPQDPNNQAVTAKGSADFVAASEEHVCTNHPGGFNIGPFKGVFHCIDKNGYNLGRADLAADVTARPSSFFGLIRPDYESLLGTATAIPKDHAYHAGTGSDDRPYDGNIVVLSVTGP